jgi:hypothetical protein
VSGSRRFIDGYGFSWQAWELASFDGRAPEASRADAAPPHGWLYFFSRGTTLVLTEYPADWTAMSWGELDTLRCRARVLGSDAGVRVPVPARGHPATELHP